MSKQLCLVLILCSAVNANAQTSVVESASARAFDELHETGNWTLKSKRALAQALWGEAGIIAEYSRVRLRNGRYSKHKIRMCTDATRAAGQCVSNRDWEVIPWVLLRRWQASNPDPHKRIRFATLITRYSSPLKPHLASKEYEWKAHKRRDMAEVHQIQRRRFIQSLRFDGSNLTRAYRRLRGHAPPKALHAGWAAIRRTVEAWGAGNVPDHCPDAEHWDMKGATVSRRLVPTCKGTLNVFYRYRTPAKS